MAELKPDDDTTTSTANTERELRARIAELEALLEARTHTILGLAAQLAEHQGSTPTFAAGRLAEAERRLAELQATKVIRYSAVPRRFYGRLRGGTGGG
jgi:hypothetical protein